MNDNTNEMNIYNDPGSLFYTPFTNDPPPAGTIPASSNKAKSPVKKAKKPASNNLTDRFKSQNDITPFFTNQTNEDNTKNKIIPIGTMNNYFYSANMQPRATIESHSKYLIELTEQYKKNGTSGLPEQIKKDKDVIEIMQKWRLADNTLLFADGASGIFKALTCYDDYFVRVEPVTDSENHIIKYLVYATLDQLKKCFFGLCVDEYGNLKHGTSEILKKSGLLNEFTSAIFASPDGKSKGKEPILYMYDKANNFLGFYKPIIFEGYDTKEKAFKMLLDPKFFKMQVDMNTGKLKADVRYIPTIGGLTSLNVIGRAYLARENPGLSIPYAKTATRLVHTLQASLNLQSLLGIDLFPDMKDKSKQKIRMNKSAIIEMFPTCYDKRYNSANFKKASEQVGLTSDILYKGLEVTNGLGDLIMAPGSNEIYLPSIDRSCYFDNQYSKAVFINCETPRQAIENTNKLSYMELKKIISNEKGN